MHAAPRLPGRVILVVGTSSPATRGIAAGLVGEGATVGLVGGADVIGTATEIDGPAGRVLPIAARLDSRTGIDDAFTVAVDAHRRVDAVVCSLITPAALEPRLLVDLDEAAWAIACERTLRSTLYVLQTAFRFLQDRGGRICILIPVVAMTGAAGLAPLAAAAEGQRALAKSAARQWGRHGITVNCLATAVPHEIRAAAPRLPTKPALGDVDADRDLAPVAAFLAGDDSSAVTGATIAVDGGDWMTP